MTKEQEILANRIKNKRQHSLNVIDEIMSSAQITELRAVTNKESSENLTFVRISLGLKKNKGMIRKINEFAGKSSCPVRVQVLLTTVEGGFNSIDDIKWLRHQLSDNVTIACSLLRLSNDFCLKYNTDEDYWMDKGELSITNRYIITLEDGTQIVLRNKSLSLTGEDPVEEEMVMNFLGEMQRGFKKEINIKSKE